MAKIETIDDLRLQLLEDFSAANGNPEAARRAVDRATIAGKILGTVKAELEYAELRKEEPFIEFLGGADTSPTAKMARKIRREIEAQKEGGGQ